MGQQIPQMFLFSQLFVFTDFDVVEIVSEVGRGKEKESSSDS